MDEVPEYRSLKNKIEKLEKELSYLKLFKSGFDVIQNARFAIGNRDYRFEAASKGYEKNFKLKKDEIIGKSAADFFEPETFKTLIKPFYDKALNGEKVHFTTWLNFPGKRKKVVNIQYYPIENKGKIDFVGILVNDLTSFEQTEKLLSQTKHNFTRIQQLAHIGTWRWDIQKDQISCSEEFFRILGIAPDNFLPTYKGYLACIHPEDRIKFNRQVTEGLHSQQPYSKTYRIVRPDGDVREIREWCEITTGKNGRLIDCFGAIQDITEEKKVKNALEKSEEKYRNLFEKAPLMYAIIENRSDTLIISDCNRQFHKALGYNREEVIGVPLTRFYTKDSQNKIFQWQDKKQDNRSKFPYPSSERELVTKDGRIIHTILQAEPEKSETGRLIGARCMYTDQSARKKAEEQLRESHKLLLTIVDGILEPLIMMDKQMQIIMVNRAAEKYFNSSNEKCLSRTCFRILKNRSTPCYDCKIPAAIRNGRPKKIERKGCIKSGRVEQVSVYPLRDRENKTWAVILRISDITQSKQIEKELIHADKMISLGILVSGVAHEINNPNNFIMLNTPVLWDAWKGILPVLDKYARQFGDFSLAGFPYSQMRNEIPALFSGIREGSERIRKIVQELKNYSRQEDAAKKINVDINRVLWQSIRLTQDMVKKATDNFTIKYGNCLPTIKGSPQKLEQVMINLIQNACQAVPQKNCGIHIESSYNTKSRDIQIIFQDQGTGIAVDQLNKIMDPFFTTKRELGGTGLGLAISSTIVKDHGGRIEVASKPGCGATFKIIFPADGQKVHLKILVADDDDHIRDALVKGLNDYNAYSAKAAATGKETLLEIGQSPPDLLILDIRMPDMDGIEVCRMLKKRPELSGIRVVVITGHPDSPNAREIEEMGYGPLVFKPFTLTEIISKIDTITGIE